VTWDGGLQGGTAAKSGDMIVVSGTTLQTPANPGRPLILQEVLGSAALVSSGGTDSYAQILDLPQNITDNAKCHITATVRGTDSSGVTPTIASHAIEYSITNPDSINIKVIGGTLAGKTISYHFLEWA
jgi:ABC-type phosphate transport system substrate-binding protein